MRDRFLLSGIRTLTTKRFKHSVYLNDKGIAYDAKRGMRYMVEPFNLSWSVECLYLLLYIFTLFSSYGRSRGSGVTHLIRR